MSALYQRLTQQCSDGMNALSSSSSEDSTSRASNISLALPIGFAFSMSAASFVMLAVLVLAVVVMIYLLVKRYLTCLRLRQSGIPTVYWRPRFINYKSGHVGEQQMSSSTITNILPRMKRLQGPYDMYGTVYGISTAVVHVAHPTPAMALLASQKQQPTNHPTSTDATALPGGRRGSLRLQGSGACKAPAYNHFKNFCGDGVFTADGEDWKQKRAAVSHALLKPATDTTFEAKLETEANRAARKLVQRLHQYVSSSSDDDDDDGKTMTRNLLPILQQATVGLIFRYITHVDLEEKLYGNPDHNHHQHDTMVGGYGGGRGGDDHSTASTVSSQESVVEEKVTSFTAKTLGNNDNNDQHEGSLAQLFRSYLESIVQIRMIILAKSRSIWFLLPQWCYRFFSTMAVDEEFTLISIRKFSAMACQTAVKGSPLAQLQTLPLYRGSNSSHGGFSKNLLDEAITLLFAGQDTSAATLSWTLHLLSLSLDVQNKLAQEVRTVLREHDDVINNDGDGDSLLSKRILAKMPYLDAVIKESMRLYPVAPFVVRRLPFAVTVGDPKSGDKVTVPANTVACVWIYSLHRHADFWSRPDEFLPERWLATEQQDAGIRNGAYMPFAAGPRNCVGQPLAHVILRTLLCQLVANFEFQDPRFSSLSDKNDAQLAKTLRKDMQAGFTVLPKDGIPLLVRERKYA